MSICLIGGSQTASDRFPEAMSDELFPNWQQSWARRPSPFVSQIAKEQGFRTLSMSYISMQDLNTFNRWQSPSNRLHLEVGMERCAIGKLIGSPENIKPHSIPQSRDKAQKKEGICKKFDIISNKSYENVHSPSLTHESGTVKSKRIYHMHLEYENNLSLKPRREK
ncbi:hypothetical protein HCBG_08014 [Histoplasma capsulatum G186AR]|uniref:Uncharacterized protein n=1 Tax=Ajellomyces capsulatus (strain G186AR / H82 / ATCC MYA-2454 / RMSCC 2432) TaxID=447093 RepID=C0NX22_AJECG|nr:uncharacterized protein HCBG_08014 [Histoplasma capsulatum G186AR]EEH03888.1 hypothetical protein HCBG_08014 [Histoplasma capsulatum G186AR]